MFDTEYEKREGDAEQSSTKLQEWEEELKSQFSTFGHFQAGLQYEGLPGFKRTGDSVCLLPAGP